MMNMGLISRISFEMLEKHTSAQPIPVSPSKSVFCCDLLYQASHGKGLSSSAVHRLLNANGFVKTNALNKFNLYVLLFG